MATTRLYVGGLGERVSEEDLRNTFSHLGSIQTIDIIRTKGRSFAYINFLPSSDNSLAKLFSTYNGCSWKGGKLKLEKAKEHYTDRLKREWEEDAELIDSEDISHDVEENTAASLQPKSTLDFEKTQLRMFFPKLSKVKSLPFRGTGKHKYSFQRVEVPRFPTHFCDCPEHYVDISSDKINDKEVKKINSATQRVLNKGGSLENRSNQPPRGSQLDDSRIQDDGMNDEEIHVMNSVMNKLLNREIAKTKQKDLHNSPQVTAPNNELQEDKDEQDEETDDDGDDIKINTGSVNFDFDSWETSLLDKMARSNEQQTSNKPAKSKLGTQAVKEKSSNKKRKSTSIDSNEKVPTSHIPKKKIHFQTQSKESEELLELKSATDSEFKKSSRKELVGDGGSGSFHLSSGGVKNKDEKLLSVGEISSGSSKHKLVHNEEPKVRNKTLSDSNEGEQISDSVHENSDGQFKDSQSKDSEELQEPKPAAGSSVVSKVATKGSSWMQKASWTQLVGSGDSSTFSISQILPSDILEKQKLNKTNDSTTLVNFNTSGSHFGGTQSSKSGLAGEGKKKDAPALPASGFNLSNASKGGNHSDSSISKKSGLEQKASDSLPGVRISETCPFMRSADSLKDWQSAKTALTSALKRKNNNKQGSAT